MAKKQATIKDDMFKKTEAAPSQEPELTKEEKERKRRPIGVYLRVSVRKEIEQIAEAEGLNIHALLAFAVSHFVREYRKGKVKITSTKKTTLDLEV